MTIVDIHCHTFNGGDLPVEGFVKHVSLRDKPWPDWAKARLARRADRMVQREMHGYEAERKVLDPLLDASALGLAPPDEALVDPGPAFEEQVAQDLRNLVALRPEARRGMRAVAAAILAAVSEGEVVRLLVVPRHDDPGPPAAIVLSARGSRGFALDAAVVNG